MKRSTTICEVEFLDRRSGYMEVVAIHNRPGTVLSRIQDMLMFTSEPCWRQHDVCARIACSSFVVEFSSSGNHEDAERFATLLAIHLGWRIEDGVLMGRCA